MTHRINVDENMAHILTWAVARAGYDWAAFIEGFPDLEQWTSGKKSPTVKQLEAFSKKTHLPFGYLFLPKPPVEDTPIPFFRTNGEQRIKVSLNVYDTILYLQQRQDWLRDYLQKNEFDTLPFAGRYNGDSSVATISK